MYSSNSVTDVELRPACLLTGASLGLTELIKLVTWMLELYVGLCMEELLMGQMGV